MKCKNSNRLISATFSDPDHLDDLNVTTADNLGVVTLHLL